MQIKENVLLADYTTFKIGGPAIFFAEVESEEELLRALDFAKQNQARVFILSGGSNILFSDNGFDGLVILNKINSFLEAKKRVFVNKEKVIVDAGVNLMRFIEFLAMSELSGFENLYGIPGSIAGAIRGNAGAFGMEIKDKLKRVWALDIESGVVKEFKRKDLNFAYRHSFFKDNPQHFILRAEFEFEKADSQKTKEQMSYILKERNKRQLQNIKSAGSFFKNPVAPKAVVGMFEKEKNTKSKEGRVPAGWLIDKLGLKGKQIGGAMISKTSANYIINTGFASSGDVLELAGFIKSKVKDEFGVVLEEEVVVLKR